MMCEEGEVDWQSGCRICGGELVVECNMVGRSFVICIKCILY